jgi:hypothetical protein
MFVTVLWRTAYPGLYSSPSAGNRLTRSTNPGVTTVNGVQAAPECAAVPELMEKKLCLQRINW